MANVNVNAGRLDLTNGFPFAINNLGQTIQVQQASGTTIVVVIPSGGTGTYSGSFTFVGTAIHASSLLFSYSHNTNNLSYSLFLSNPITAQEYFSNTGGARRDFILSGNDTLNGAGQADVLYAGGGNDIVNGNGNNDRLIGQSGNDQLFGGAGDDTLEGGDGEDTLEGGDGADTLLGGSNNDRLVGGNGNDTLNGGDGADLLIGGSGNDVLTGLTGADRMEGGAGNDTYTVDNAGDLVLENASPDRYRVSIAANGSQGTGVSNNGSQVWSASADGKFVLFSSSYNGFLPDDNNNALDLFRKNLETGEIVRVNTTPGGTPFSMEPHGAAISADGRLVAFVTGTNGIPEDVTSMDVYVKDLQTGALVIASRDAGGNPIPNNNVQTPDEVEMSADGRYVAFSYGFGGGTRYLYVKDLQTGALQNATTAADGTPGTGGGAVPLPFSLSANGRHVVFTTPLSGLVPEDTNGARDLFYKNLDTGEITRLATEVQYDPGGPDISADGRYVVYLNFNGFMFVRDMQTGVATQIGAGTGPSLSDDGRYLAYLFNDGMNLNAYVRDLQTGAVALASTSLAGALLAGPSVQRVLISRDGKFVYVQTSAANAVAGDTNGEYDVIAYVNPLAGPPAWGAVDSGGTDLVQSLVSYTLPNGIESLTLTGSADISGTGNALANIIIGNGAHNTLSGGGGTDSLRGGAGNDTYVLLAGDQGDSIVEAANAGTDLVLSEVNHTLGANVENLTLTGSANLVGTGNALNNVLTGNAGANVLAGGGGNDTYFIQDGSDQVSENANAGIDTVVAAFTVAVLPANVENAILAGTGNFDASGNGSNNVLTGNSGDNRLAGGGGNDTLNGAGGNDTAVYAGNRSQYLIGRANGAITVNSAADGLDTLAGIEWIEFNDALVRVDANPALSGRTDFDDNGSGDILWRSSGGTIHQWLMNGDAFGSQAEPRTGLAADWQVGAVNDLNGDGRADVVLRHADGRMNVWLMNGGTVANEGPVMSGGTALSGPIDPAWRLLGSTDFNGDGKGDLLLRHDTGRVSIWLMDGRTRTGALALDAALSPLTQTAVGTGDFNGDGRGDILWRNESGAVSLWQMNGTAVAANLAVSGPEFSGDTGWIVAGTGDANADGRADVLWRNEADGRLGLWLMNGASVSASGEIAAPAGWESENLADWQVAEVNDYDGDGRHDLLLRKTDGTNAIWTLDGSTAESSTLLPGAPPKGTDWAVTGQPLPDDATTGNALPNRLIGDGGADTLRGLAGNDRLEGRGGDDVLIGGAGNDVMVGGAGNDTATFASLRAQATITVSGGVTTVVSPEGTDTLSEIENLVFSDDVPEVAVSGGGLAIADGDATTASADGTDFGPVIEGQPGVERTFVVANVGQTILTTANLALPAGYTVVEGLSGAIAAGASDTFTVRLETDAAGTYGGTVSFESNDTDEHPFEFAVTGTVAEPPATLLAIAATDAVLLEGHSGSRPFTFTVTRSGDTTGVTTVDWAVAGGASPQANAADFTGGALPAGTLAFDPDEVSKVITIEVAGDGSFEASGAAEGFQVTLSNPGGDTGFTQASAAGSILDDDVPPPPPSLSGVTDFNGDGSGDIIWRNENGSLTQWLMDGTGFGSEVEPLPGIGPGWTVLGTSDFNGDAKTDIALRHADGRLFFWLMNGGAIVESGSVVSNGVVNTAPIHPSWRVVGASDFNGDGNGDLLFRHDNGQVSVWLLDGRNRLDIKIQLADRSPLSKTLVGTGDFDGDGRGDILWRDDAGQITVWRTSDVPEALLDVTLGPVGDPLFAGDTDWVVAGTGDANGDNRADVVWQNETDGRLGLWLMNEGVTGSSGELTAPGDWAGGALADWRVVEVNDYDGDRRHDLLLRKEDGTNAIWKLDGLTVESSTLLPGAPPKGAAWAVAGQPLPPDVGTGDALPNRQAGDSGDDTIRGLAGDDLLEGRGGNDTLIGGSGADTLLGGDGNDVLEVASAAFALASGGEGNDTLRFGTTNLALDFTQITNDRAVGIERIDMTGAGNNTLRLSVADVLALTGSAATWLVIDGDPAVGNVPVDVVQLTGIAPLILFSGGYGQYAYGGTTLLIENGVQLQTQV